ncbi:glycosyltransferase [Mordavella massiliensis]|uniref:Glycosyltransferase n=1 Tax=Mordavella massiliensis TaxID=1871024 RepID=A0A938XBQ6_9CLOT|nr:glycosyltransferase [Mordavella massiliensis]MBM6949110.1 glycosyltransferase [Mordavella massiliensis]
MCRIAVLLSSYNGCEFIEDQINSILHQKGNFEITLYIRDDGSSDSTCDIIKRLQGLHSNIILFEGENIGVNSSFLELMRLAKKSDYYAISDQDDIWMDDKLSSAILQLQRIERESRPLLYGSASLCVDKGLNALSVEPHIYRSISVYNTMIQNFIGGHTQVFNYKFCEIALKTFDAESVFLYDSFFTNIGMIYKGLVFDETPHVMYRLHEKNAVGTGVGLIDWIKKNIIRVQKGQSKLYAKQFDYIANTFKKELSCEENEEIKKFQNSKTNFFTRIRYIVTTKFYRQHRVENYFFKMMYLFGGYNY